MGRFHRTRQVSRALSDATGLSEEEFWLMAAATAITTALWGVLRITEFVTDLTADLNRQG